MAVAMPSKAVKPGNICATQKKVFQGKKSVWFCKFSGLTVLDGFGWYFNTISAHQAQKHFFSIKFPEIFVFVYFNSFPFSDTQSSPAWPQKTVLADMNCATAARFVL